jgi:hypothetical protein
MARYDTYIRGDDRVQEELDFGFIGFNNRLRPDQLKPGILGDSQNGRLSENTEWQTRKGIDNIKAPLAVGGSALTLPFNLDDTGTRPELNDNAVNEVYGSCIFSDPNSESDSYIILAANTKAVAIKVSDPSTSYDLAYPSGETISSSVDMIQAFNKLFIFRKGDTPFEKDLASTNINTSPTLDKVESGEYQQPVTLIADGTNKTTVADGVVTANFTADFNGAAVGKPVRMMDTGGSNPLQIPGDFIEGTIFEVDDPNAVRQIKFYADLPDNSDVADQAFMVPHSVGLGFTHMPAPEYGIYHQKRLAVPYRYNVSDAVDTYTDRKIFDEIILSDILDTNTYDQVYGQFRFNAGAADFNVGMHSFSDDKLIVFNRNSIHLVQNSLDLASASVQLLTDEVGLIARDSIIQVGNQVLFLSDNGIYGMSFVDLYNLRGNEVPLSESIDPTIKTIDKANASKASAVYFDNRYYIAVPTGTDGFNNKILIYNFLTKEWESIDSVGTTDIDGASVQAFEFTKLLVAGEGDNRGVYVVNTDGGIHKLEVYEDGIDRIITEIGVTTKKNVRVNGSATTRMFTVRSIDRKKWNNFEMHLQSSPNVSSNVSLSATTENIDSDPVIDLKTADFYLGNVIGAGEDVSIRGRIGNKRAYGLQMTIESTEGRPRMRSVKVAGSETFRSTSSVE